MPKNQCDGCRRGLPLEQGIHHAHGEMPYIACTADLYKDKLELFWMIDKNTEEAKPQVTIHSSKEKALAVALEESKWESCEWVTVLDTQGKAILHLVGEFA